MRTYQPKIHPDGTPNSKFRSQAGRVKSSGPSGRMLNKFTRGDFVAWDGEGATDVKGSEQHRYIMLCTSRGDTCIERQGLSTQQCLDMLATIGERERNAIHVIYGGSYDINMMVGDLPREQLEALWNGEAAEYGGYELRYVPRKTLTLTRLPIQYRKTARGVQRVSRASMTLWDVIGFFQAPFVDAVAEYLGQVPELQNVIEHKKQRASFRAQDMDDILHYCHQECALLVALMRRLREYFVTAELEIRRWDGAGACAAALLRREHTRDHMACGNRIPTLRAVEEAATYAYAGGRSEVMLWGHAPQSCVYHYDINSAYPAAMQYVPSLARGYWKRHTRPSLDVSPFTLFRVRWEFGEDAPFYPFFWRWKTGAIYFPARGEGWYWAPEVFAACDYHHLLGGSLTLLDAWEWIPETDAQPFAFLPMLYEQRKAWKRQGIGAQMALKLAINSLYGKTAQHVGWSPRRGKPRFHQIEWAGWITSSTRAALFRAGMSAPYDVIFFATDGIYSRSPLNVQMGSNLGEWEYEECNGITVVASGVYFCDQQDGKTGVWCRGFDRGSLSREAIVEHWRKRRRTYTASLTRFVTMGSALASETIMGHWRTWRTVPRALDLWLQGTKRVPVSAHAKPHRGLCETVAALPIELLAGEWLSYPFPLPWNDVRVHETLDGVPLSVVEYEHLDSEVM